MSNDRSIYPELIRTFRDFSTDELQAALRIRIAYRPYKRWVRAALRDRRRQQREVRP